MYVGRRQFHFVFISSKRPSIPHCVQIERCRFTSATLLHPSSAMQCPSGVVLHARIGLGGSLCIGENDVATQLLVIV
jgi:hypothetical protein